MSKGYKASPRQRAAGRHNMMKANVTRVGRHRGPYKKRVR